MLSASILPVALPVRELIDCGRERLHDIVHGTGHKIMGDANYKQLIARAQSGDEAAIDRLLDVCRQRLKELANGPLTEQLGADWDPSDVIQESLLEAYQGLTSFRGQQSEALWAWLRTIMEHNVADRLKHERRQKRNGGAQRSLEGVLQNGRSLRELLVADQSSVSERVVRQENLSRLNVEIDELPPQQALVFRMRHEQGLSLDEIAEVTGRTHASIAGLLIRANRRLNEFLQQARHR
ncbi:MAG: sigma-70 family RNA polymerase sigma factor [Planctomycetaceae bacterium]